MIFKKIIFQNFKTYYGIQEVDLYIPPEVTKTTGKNIILFGGLNGAGKTTFLKAILYVLFGKRGITHETNPQLIEKEYIQLFSNVINNNYFDEGGRECSVTLILETDAGEEYTLKVKWYVNPNKKVTHEVRELSVKPKGSSKAKKYKIDAIGAFDRFIDRIIPFYAVPFFMFDGEEIRILIEKQNDSGIKDAIKKICGLQANELLISDLRSLKQKLERDLSKASNSVTIKKLQEELDLLNEELCCLQKKSKNHAEKINQYQERINELRDKRRQKLLANSNSRENIAKRQSEIETKLKLKREELNNFLSMNMVSILLASKISLLQKQLMMEKKKHEQSVLQDAVLKPFEDFLNKLLQVEFNPPLTSNQITQLKKAGSEIWLENKNKKTENYDHILVLHDLNSKDLNHLLNLKTISIDPAIHLINEIEKLSISLEEIDKELAKAPNAIDTTAEEKQIESLNKELGQYQLLKSNTTKKINKLIENKRALETKISKNTVVTESTEQLYAQIQYLDRTIQALIKYDEEYTNYKANIIKTEFESMLMKLFRKQGEFGQIEFDIDTFTIRIYNDRGQEISITDRSAGEKQMISSALIWALTRASDLQLPVVIDTPLGRLDSQHRKHLVEHYYRYLSNQVIVLSTDTEITREYINIMSEAAYKQYMLDYDEEKKYTVIRDGYFKFVGVN